MDSSNAYCQFCFQAFTQSQTSDCIFKQILDMARVGFLVAAPDGTIRYANKTYADMFQLDLERMPGTNICKYFPNSRLLTVMRTGKADEGIIFSYKGREAFISRYPIFFEGQLLGGYIEVYCRDITELSELAQRVRILERKVRLCKDTLALPKSTYTFNDIVSGSPVMETLKARANKFAQADIPVLIIGETGTGKELMAHSIHAVSPRSAGPFITVNCAAIPENLLESELFGYEGGTFTGARQGGMPGKFELANGGTIFLDEIGDLSLPLQAKLLRVIETKEIQKLGKSQLVPSDFRLIAATNLNLWKTVDKGGFRRDLFFRLCSLLLQLPPLRERKEDIALIVEHQLQAMKTLGAQCELRVHPEVMALLERYPWPGNVRELRNLVSSAAVSLDAGEDVILLRHLPPYMFGLHDPGNRTDDCAFPADAREVMPLRQARHASERETILAAVREAGGNKKRAAGLLGISRNELYRKLRRLEGN